MEYATLLVHTEEAEVLPGQYSRLEKVVECRGPKHAPFLLDDDFLMSCNTVFPWPYKVVGHQEWSGKLICVRSGKGHLFDWLYPKVVLALARLRFRERVVLTCMIWGLAKTQLGTIPAWNDIYAIAAIKKRWDVVRTRKRGPDVKPS